MPTIRFHQRALLAAAALTLAACQAREGGSPQDTAAPAVAAAPGADSGAARGDSVGATARDSTSPTAGRGGWSNAQVLALAVAASDDEIAEGRLAATKATSAEVKAFGRQMASDHEALRRQARAYAERQKVVADTTHGDVADLLKDAREDIRTLTDRQAGADWDRAFLDEEIEDHETLLKQMQDAATNAADPALRELLARETGKVQEHLTKAKALKERYPRS